MQMTSMLRLKVPQRTVSVEERVMTLQGRAIATPPIESPPTLSVVVTYRVKPASSVDCAGALVRSTEVRITHDAFSISVLNEGARHCS